MIFSRIIGTGGYLPETIITNSDLELLVDTSDQWIRERTGIRKRHIVSGDETTTSIAEQAALRAMEAAGKSSSDIDLIILSSTTPDLIYPSTACLLQSKLGIKGCAAFDVQAVCTGFIYALGIADNFVRTGSARCALIVAAECTSKIIDWTDRGTCVLFGDGAGAVVIEASDEPGILSSHLHADGDYASLLQVPVGIGKGFDQMKQRAYVEMSGNEVYKMAIKTLGRIVDETLEKNNLEKSDIDWLIPHQANIRIIQATARKLRMPMDHVVVTVDQHANTQSASVPLALDEAVRDGRIKRGETLMMEAFGGGFTWGSVLAIY